MKPSQRRFSKTDSLFGSVVSEILMVKHNFLLLTLVGFLIKFEIIILNLIFWFFNTILKKLF